MLFGNWSALFYEILQRFRRNNKRNFLLKYLLFLGLRKHKHQKTKSKRMRCTFYFITDTIKEIFFIIFVALSLL